MFEVLASVFPDAARFCLWNESEGRFTGVGETALARTPLRASKAAALPFMPLAWRNLPAVNADWVLCSSHLFAHHATFRGLSRTVPKLAYVHTPARYIWAPELDGRGRSVFARAVSSVLKPVDRARAQELSAIAANSRFVAERIRESWGRDSEVIYPPVDVGDFAGDTPSDLSPEDESLLRGLPSDYLLGASRFVPYKRLDLAIRAGLASGVPVVLAGEGSDETRLRALASDHGSLVTFVPRPTFALLRELYRRARALVFAPIEDFGIMPVEAMATGTPVIANSIGGAAETVLHGRTGALVTDWTESELRAAVDLISTLDRNACATRAWDFDRAVFARRMTDWVVACTNAGAPHETGVPQ